MTNTAQLSGQIFINEGELELLYALRELCPGYNEPGSIMPGAVIDKIDIDMEEMKKRSSLLQGFGLVYIRWNDLSTFGDMKFGMSHLALSTAGESYLRAIDAQPKVAKRVTLNFFNGAREAVLGAARVALGEMVKQGVLHLTRQ